MVVEIRKSKAEFELVERTVSRPGATLEIKVVEIPQVVQQVISANLEQVRVAKAAQGAAPKR
jgi:hypothetical protein